MLTAILHIYTSPRQTLYSPRTLAQRETKLSKIASGRFFDIFLDHPSVFFLVRTRHTHHVETVPVEANEARDEEFDALLAFVLARRFARGKTARGRAGIAADGLDEVG